MGWLGSSGEASRAPNTYSVFVAMVQTGGWGLSRGSEGISGMGDNAEDLSSGSGV